MLLAAEGRLARKGEQRLGGGREAAGCAAGESKESGEEGIPRILELRLWLPPCNQYRYDPAFCGRGKRSQAPKRRRALVLMQREGSCVDGAGNEGHSRGHGESAH